MTQQYNPYKNAVAKRINERSKYEFRLKTNYKNSTLAKRMIKRVLSINKKKHFSIKLNTLDFVHINQNIKRTNKIWNI